MQRMLGLMGMAFLSIVPQANAGLKAYWTFDNTVADSTGNATMAGVLEPTLAPPTYDFGNKPTVGGVASLNLTAANTRFHIPYQPAVALNKATDFTISMWLDPSSAGTQSNTVGGRIFDNRGTGAGGAASGLQFKIAEAVGTNQWNVDPTNSFYYIDNGTGGAVGGPGSGLYSDNVWHHLAIAYSASTQQTQYYIDGAAVGAPTSLSSILLGANDFASTKDFSIGAELYVNNVLQAMTTARTQKFTGWVDELAFFDQRLSDADILGLAQGTLLPSSFLNNNVMAPEPMSLIMWGSVAVVFAGLSWWRTGRRQVA